MAEQLTIEQLQIIISANMSKLQSEFKKVQTEINKGAKEIDRSFGKLTTNLNSVNNSLKTMNGNVTNVKKNMEALTASVTKTTNSIKEALNATNQLKTAISGVNTNIVIKTQYAESKQSNSSTADMMSSLAMGATVGRVVGEGIVQANIGERLRSNIETATEPLKESLYQKIKTPIEKAMQDVAAKLNSFTQANLDSYKAITKEAGYYFRYAGKGYEELVRKQAKVQSKKFGETGLYDKAIFKGYNPEDGEQSSIATYQTTFTRIQNLASKCIENVRYSMRNMIPSSIQNNFNSLGISISNSMNNAKININTLNTALKIMCTSTVSLIKSKFDLLAYSMNKASTIAGHAIQRGLYRNAVAVIKPIYNITNSIRNMVGSSVGIQKTVSIFNKMKNSVKSMATSIKNARNANKGYRVSLEAVRNSTNRVKTATNGLIGTLRRLLPFLSVFMIIRGIGKSISSAMDSIENENLIGVIFGKDTKAIKEWADTLQDKVGVASEELQKNAATVFNMATSLGMGRDSAMDMSMALAGLAGDMASFYNISSDEAFTKLRSGITGETEALKQLGIMVDVNTLKQYGYNDAMSNSEKMMIRYKAIMAQTSTAQGDFARSIDSPANQLRLLQLQLKQTMIALGKCFMPIVQTVLPVLNLFVRALNKVLGVIANFMYALFGIKMTSSSGGAGGGIGEVASDVSDLGGNLDNATTSAKKLKGSLMGFDEINIMSTNKDSGSSGGSGGSGGGSSVIDPTIDFEEGEVPFNKYAQKIKDIFNEVKGYVVEHAELFSLLVGNIAGHFTYLMATNEEFRESIMESVGRIRDSFTAFYEETLKPFAEYFIRDVVNPIVASIEENLLPVLQEMYISWSNILAEIVDLILDNLTNIIEIILRPGLDLMTTIITDVLEVIKCLWDKYGKDISDNIAEFVDKTSQILNQLWDKVINPIIKPILDTLKWLWENVLKNILEKVAEFVLNLINSALEIYNKFIAPLIIWFLDKLQPIITSVMNTLIPIVKWLGNTFTNVFNGIIRVANGLIDFIAGVFTGNWRKAFQGLIDIVGGIFDGLIGIVKAPINAIIGMVNDMIDGINKIKVPDWVPAIGGKGINIPKIPRLARGGIIDKPTLMGSYIAGDSLSGGAQKEMVVPLENTSFTTKIALAMGEAVENAMERKFPRSNSSDTRDIVIQVGSTEFARVAINSINELQSQVGATLINF